MTKFIASIFSSSLLIKSSLRKILAVLVLICSLPAFAGGGIDTNGGGHTVKVNDQHFLFDLWEMGITEDVMIGSQSFGNYAEKLTQKNSHFADVADLVSQKIQDIASRDPVLAGALVKAADLYSWSFVNNNLTVTEPADSAIDMEIYQGAVRKGYVIYIALPIWKQMPKEHQAALIIHELISALTKKDMPDSRARQVTAFVFSNEFLSVSSERWSLLVTYLLPSITSFQVKPLISKDLQYMSPTLMLAGQNYLWNLKDSLSSQLKNICAMLETAPSKITFKVSEVWMTFDRPTEMDPNTSLRPKLFWNIRDKILSTTRSSFGGRDCVKHLNQDAEMKQILNSLKDYK